MNDLNWINVSSSNISRIAYDEHEQYLYVEFSKSGIYIYKNVNSIEFENFLNAPSLGSYLNNNIKPFYPYEKT